MQARFSLFLHELIGVHDMFHKLASLGSAHCQSVQGEVLLRDKLVIR